MKNLKLTPLVAIALMLALALAGCETSSDDGLTGSQQVGVDDYDGMDLNQPYGGLTATDEEEAFGDPYLMQMAAVEDDMAVEDPLADDPEVVALENAAGQDDPGNPNRPRFTFLRMAWGMLDGPVDSTGAVDESVDLLDWSGMLTVDRGIVIVRRVILFERPYDHLIFPRLNRQTVAWVSHTGNHFDGLLIEIIERPGDLNSDSKTDPEPNMLHFTTGPFTESFPVAELAELDEIYPVEPEGNAIHFAGFRLTDIIECPKGFLGGIWRAVSDNVDTEIVEGGVFKGRWVGLFGHLHGFLRGRFGINEEGERVFYGKYISRRGHFRGLLRGTWEPLPEYPGHGLFHGQWVNAAGTVEGVLGGDYFALPERPGGFFGGRWATLCDDEAVDSIE